MQWQVADQLKTKAVNLICLLAASCAPAQPVRDLSLSIKHWPAIVFGSPTNFRGYSGAQLTPINKPKRQENRGVRFEVRVQALASRNEIAGVQNGVLRVRLQAPPVDGAANEALIAYMADELGVSRREVRIVSGFGSRNKILEVDPRALAALDRIRSPT